MSELEISRLSYAQREEASHNAARPRPRTGQFRGVVQLARAKGRYVPPHRPIPRKNSKGAKR
jgi:hypothetical protein